MHDERQLSGQDAADSTYGIGHVGDATVRRNFVGLDAERLLTKDRSFSMNNLYASASVIKHLLMTVLP